MTDGGRGNATVFKRPDAPPRCLDATTSTLLCAMLDPDDRTFEIFELQRGAAASDGLRLDIDALWAYIDRLA